MAVSPYTFVVDIASKRLRASRASTIVADPPVFYRASRAPFSLSLINTAALGGDGVPALVPVPAGATLKLTIGVRGTARIITALIPAAANARDEITGTLDVGQLRAALGDADEVPAVMELTMLEAGGRAVLLDQACTLRNVVDVDDGTDTEVQTGAGLAIMLCELAEADARGAALEANDAAGRADSAADYATQVATQVAMALAETVLTPVALVTVGPADIDADDSYWISPSSARARIIEFNAAERAVRVRPYLDPQTSGWLWCDVLHAGASGSSVRFDDADMTVPMLPAGGPRYLKRGGMARLIMTEHACYVSGDLLASPEA